MCLGKSNVFDVRANVNISFLREHNVIHTYWTRQIQGVQMNLAIYLKIYSLDEQLTNIKGNEIEQ